jgi:hypothetical protein
MAETLYGGVDPALINRALEAQGVAYRVPMAPSPVVADPAFVPAAVQPPPEPPPVPAAVNGVAPSYVASVRAANEREAAANASDTSRYLDEAVIRQNAQAAGVSPDYAVSLARSNGRLPPAAPAAPEAAPAPAAAPVEVVPPGARMSMAQPSAATQAQGTAPVQPKSVGPRMPASPFGAMERDARQRYGVEQGQADAAEMSGDINTESARVAIEEQGQAQRQTGDAMAETFERAGAASAGYADRLKVLEGTQREAEQRIQGEIEADTKFINEYEPKDRRTKGQRVASALAVALGGLGRAFSAAAGIQTRNTALDLIQSQIERDLEMQRGMLDNKKTALAAKSSALGQARQRYQDDREALNFARVVELDGYQKQIEAEKAKGMGQEAAAKADELSALLGAQRDNLLQGLHGAKAERYRAEAQAAAMAKYQEDRARAAAARGPSTMDQLKLQEQALKNRKLAQELGEGGGLDPKVKAKVQSQERVIQLIDKIQKLRKENPVERGLPGWLPGVSAPAELGTLEREFDLEYKNAKELGSLDNGTLAVLDELRGNAASWGGDAGAKLDIIKRNTENARAMELGQRTPDELESMTRPHGAK